jgi:phosphate:Na+ symporter
MIKEMIFGIVGGLGLFLFGMTLMSEGLKKVAGQKLRSLLGSLTKHRIIAVLVGTVVTCLIQSSSATTVMTVGFVNAGLLTLRQALCVIMGANIGTTITAWLVSAIGIEGLEITAYALPAIGIGFLLQIVGRTQKTRSLGSMMLGFGLLFLGILFMEKAFEPLKDSQNVQNTLIWLGQNPILAVLAGTAITMLIQSSSASIAMIQLLAASGAFGTDWNLALQVTIPFVLGDNIGTTITAQLAALRTSRNSRRAAMGHTIFNLIGVIYILPLVWVGLFAKIVTWISPWQLSQSTVMVHIAIAHTTFNVFNTIVFLPIISWLELIVLKIIPLRQEELEQKPVILEKHLLHTPIIALDQARREIVRMTDRAQKAVQQAIDGLVENDRSKLTKAMRDEELTDGFQHEITSYLVELSREQLSDEVSRELPTLLHTVNDLERIGDHAVNITEIAERKIDQRLSFSDTAQKEAGELKNEVMQMFDYISPALSNNDANVAQSALTNENNLNKMQIDFRRSHVQRMTEGICSPEAGLIFIDLVDNVEKIGDHLTNIAQAVIGGLQWDGVDKNALSGEYQVIQED